MAYTLNHEAMQAKVQEITAASYELGAAWLRSIATDDELPMPAEQLVRVIHALTEGLVFQRLLTPDLVPDEVFYAAFEALTRASSEAGVEARRVGQAITTGMTLGVAPFSASQNCSSFRTSMLSL